MNTLEIICGIIMLITCLVITVLVVLQESPKQGGLGALTGTTDSFFSRNQARTKDAMLANATKISAIVFFVVTIVVYTLISRVG